MGQIVSVTGSQMQFVAINWHVYLLTKSAFALGLVQLGELESGIVAGLIGAPIAVVIGGFGSLISAAVAAVKSKSLMTFEIK